jgi:hypothetical protein
MSDCSTNALKAKKPRNCRHCTHMVCGDANWCSEKEETMSDAAISAHRKCSSFEYNPIDALTLDGIDDVFRAERERALYEKRMRGDWS